MPSRWPRKRASTTEFKGYESTDLSTTVGAVDREGERLLVKLVESPFYATGGGQVSDSGWVECEDGDCAARVDEVLRLGDDQVVALVPERGHELAAGERVRARVDRSARHATECNHTATHLLHAALRARLGTHVRQAGSYVGPDKLRFDFTHGSALSPDDLAHVEQTVNDWITAGYPVRAFTTTLDEAKSLGAMALFGEKYGEIVRMIEVGDGDVLTGAVWRHPRRTRRRRSGCCKISSETSSAANVRRIEAITGPVAVGLDARSTIMPWRKPRRPCGCRPSASPASSASCVTGSGSSSAARGASSSGGGAATRRARARGGRRSTVLGVLAAAVPELDGQALLALIDALKAKLGECRDRARLQHGGQGRPRRRGIAVARGTRSQGRRDRQGGRRRRRRWRRRPRHARAGRRARAGEAARDAIDAARAAIEAALG